MASTWLDLQEAIAENLGKTDGATYSTKRAGAANRARRKYYSEYPWKFCRKVGQTLTFTSQVATLPSDFNGKFDPVRVYKYVGNVIYQYRQVEWADLSSWGNVDYVYAVDPANDTVKISQSDSTLSIDYCYLPADNVSVSGSNDSVAEPASDITAIALLATAYFYLSSRQSKGSYGFFMDEYGKQLKEDERSDAGITPVRYFKPPVRRIQTGYTSAY